MELARLLPLLLDLPAIVSWDTMLVQIVKDPTTIVYKIPVKMVPLVQVLLDLLEVTIAVVLQVSLAHFVKIQFAE